MLATLIGLVCMHFRTRQVACRTLGLVRTTQLPNCTCRPRSSNISCGSGSFARESRRCRRLRKWSTSCTRTTIECSDTTKDCARACLCAVDNSCSQPRESEAASLLRARLGFWGKGTSLVRHTQQHWRSCCIYRVGNDFKRKLCLCTRPISFALARN